MRNARTVTRPSFEHRTALIILVLLALSGCGSEVAGTPRTVASFSGGTPTTLLRRAGADPFARLNPCQILDQALTGQGYSAAKRSDADAAHNCDAKKTDYGVIGLALQPGQTIVDPRKAVTGDVNGRPAVQEREALGGTGSCDVSMEVAPNSRATVLVTLQTAGTDEACRLVNDVSTKVEPLLPK
jgi:hypothetical protein